MAYIQTANRTIERSPNVARLTGLSREPSTSQGERARRVVETAVGTRTYFTDARRIVPSNGCLSGCDRC